MSHVKTSRNRRLVSLRKAEHLSFRELGARFKISGECARQIVSNFAEVEERRKAVEERHRGEFNLVVGLRGEGLTQTEIAFVAQLTLTKVQGLLTEAGLGGTLQQQGLREYKSKWYARSLKKNK